MEMKKAGFNWECIHCKKRNLEKFNYQFDIPKSYSTTWVCKSCDKKTGISFIFTIMPAGKQK
jgi:3-methyladenine DNA glycosylase Tag